MSLLRTRDCAIIAGERSPDALPALCDQQIRRSKAEQVKEALRGTWEAEHIFALRQAVQSWDHYQQQIAECDRQIYNCPKITLIAESSRL